MTTYDPTKHPDIDEHPALTTRMTPEQFRQWINAPGDIYLTYLPGRRSFPTKVPPEQHAFFISMIEQLRMCLGPEVHAVRAAVVDAPPHPQHDSPQPPAIDAAPTRHEYRTKTCEGAGTRPSETTHDKDQPSRGRCDWCGAVYQLTKTGTLRAHRAR
jgi:hypothetical protein